MSAPLPYIDRIRDYYQALGYGAPYVWARCDSVPFARPRRALTACTLGIVTTAAPYQPGKGPQGPGAPYNGAAKFFTVYAGSTQVMPDLRISHIAYDREHSSAADQGSYFPLKALSRLAGTGSIRGRIGRVGPRFYGLPTNRSHRKTREVDCVELLRMVQEDGVDAVLLVPNCPVCHQSVSLAAHALEGAGIATVILGCARDIVEHVGVPRLLFSNLPLGNAAGLPNDQGSQDLLAAMAVDLLEQATGPRTTVRSPLEWPGDPEWQRSYSNAALLTEAEISRRRAEFDQAKVAAKAARS